MNRDLVLYLEELLASAREGRVQFFVGSAGISAPPSARGGGSMDVRALGALGGLVVKYDPVSRHQAYTTTLAGLSEAVSQLDASLGVVTKPAEG